jgi:hypothetical protein
MQSPVPLGDVIAERRFTLKDSGGQPREIAVRLGRPVRGLGVTLHYRAVRRSSRDAVRTTRPLKSGGLYTGTLGRDSSHKRAT